MDKNGLLCRSADKVSCPNSASVQQLPMGFWQGKRPSFWVHFIWIHRVLSLLQLCRKKLFQNTPKTLCSGPIFPSRSGCQFPEKSPKSPTFSSCFLLLVFTKSQPRCPHFLMILEVELLDIIPQLFLFGLGFPFIESYLDFSKFWYFHLFRS